MTRIIRNQKEGENYDCSVPTCGNEVLIVFESNKKVGFALCKYHLARYYQWKNDELKECNKDVEKKIHNK